MKQLRFFLPVTLILAFSLSTQAQDVEEKGAAKNELSVDFSEVLRSDALPGLIYKRHFKKGALRARINFNFSGDSRTVSGAAPDSTIFRVESTTENTKMRFDVFLGYQWNRPVAKNLTILYGFDFYLGMDNTTNEVLDVNFNALNQVRSSLRNTQEEAKMSFGLSPLVGFRYQLNRSFALGMESFWLGSFTQSTLSTTIVQKTTAGTSTSITEVEPTSFAFSMKPTTLFVIGYYF